MLNYQDISGGILIAGDPEINPQLVDFTSTLIMLLS